MKSVDLKSGFIAEVETLFSEAVVVPPESPHDAIENDTRNNKIIDDAVSAGRLILLPFNSLVTGIGDIYHLNSELKQKSRKLQSFLASIRA
ncbi:MAG: hypothetical protein ACYC6O_02225 [Thermoleophilia bacterium]